MFRFSLPLEATFGVLLGAVPLDSTNCTLSSDKLPNTHPNSAGLRRSSASKHCLLVDAQKHVNSLKVLAKAQVRRGHVDSCQIACFRRGLQWFFAAALDFAHQVLIFLLNSGRAGLSLSLTHTELALPPRSHLPVLLSSSASTSAALEALQRSVDSAQFTSTTVVLWGLVFVLSTRV